VAINMAQTLDGRVAPGGKAKGIGGPADRALMRRLRSGADAVMTGAGTLRAERVDLSVPDDLARERSEAGRPPQPLAVTLTGTGEIPLSENLVGDRSGGLVVLCAPSVFHRTSALVAAPPGDRARAIPVPGDADGVGLDLAAALRALRDDLGVQVLLVEGGPSLNHQLVSRGLADELFFTLAPRLAGGPPDPGLLSGPEPLPEHRARADLASAHLSAEGELFLRYRLR